MAKPALKLDLTGTDTSRPVLPTEIYAAEIFNAEIVESKKVAGNYNLALTFKTIDETTSTKGKKINPGYQLRSWVPLQQSDNPDAPDYKESIAILVDAAFQVSDPGDRPEFNNQLVEDLKGKTVLLRVAEVDDEQYGPGNDVKRIMPAE